MCCINMKNLIIISFVFLLIASCKEDDLGVLTLNFKLENNGDEVGLNEEVIINGVTLTPSLIEFYMGNMQLKNGNSTENLSEILFIDFENSSSISYPLPKGDFTSLNFDLGVPEDLNSANPATYDINHPLSLDNNMYWNMNGKYVFTKFEALIANDTNTVVYHIGKPTYMRSVSLNNDIAVAPGGINVITVSLDINDIFNATTIVNPAVENESHSQAGRETLTENLANNWQGAFSIE